MAKRLFMVLLMVATGGCGPPDERPRVGVSGKVTLGSEPLPNGTIAFVPLDSGPAAQGPILAGSYSVPPSEGPGLGRYRVEVYSIQPTGKRVVDRALSNELVDEKRNVVPRRYNIDSGLKVEIEPSGGHEFNFTLDQNEDSRPTTRTAGRGRGRR